MIIHLGHLPSDNLRQGGKRSTVLLHSFLLADRANSGFTLSITPLRYDYSKHLVETKMSVLDPVLYTYFE